VWKEEGCRVSFGGAATGGCCVVGWGLCGSQIPLSFRTDWLGSARLAASPRRALTAQNPPTYNIRAPKVCIATCTIYIEIYQCAGLVCP